MGPENSTGFPIWVCNITQFTKIWQAFESSWKNRGACRLQSRSAGLDMVGHAPFDVIGADAVPGFDAEVKVQVVGQADAAPGP